jgi:hypothetical protein
MKILKVSLFIISLFFTSASVVAQNLLPLQLYWSSARGDNFVTATNRGGNDALNAGYNYVRDEACILSSKQRGTIPLNLYWSSKRGDNFTATTNKGARDARVAKYRFARVEGISLYTTQINS